ncbi:MAG: hypothetical protein ACON38_19500 [Akkermansiaceae bacterium]
MAEQDHKVSLGCGTLILIAIIVLIFGNKGTNEEVEKRVERIESKLDEIQEQLDQLPKKEN